MKNILRFGSALVLGGALAVAASGCGGTSTGPTGGKATPKPSAAASGSVAQEQSAAIATVRAYMKTMGPISNVTFKVFQGPKREWKVSFQGAYTETSASAIAIDCGAPGMKPGQTLYLTTYPSGYMLTSSNGRSLGTSPLELQMPAGTPPTVNVTCPPAG